MSCDELDDELEEEEENAGVDPEGIRAKVGLNIIQALRNQIKYESGHSRERRGKLFNDVFERYSDAMQCPLRY